MDIFLTIIATAIGTFIFLYFLGTIMDFVKKLKWMRKRRIENAGRPPFRGLDFSGIAINRNWEENTFRAYLTYKKAGETLIDYENCGWGDHPMDAVNDLLINLNHEREQKWDKFRKGN